VKIEKSRADQRERDWKAITASHFNSYALKGDGTHLGLGHRNANEETQRVTSWSEGHSTEEPTGSRCLRVTIIWSR
jgi:hypothetical protein